MSAPPPRPRELFFLSIIGANGEMRDVEVNTGPIDVRGKTLLTRSSTTSPSGSRAEEALQESEEKYRNIFDLGAMGIVPGHR